MGPRLVGMVESATFWTVAMVLFGFLIAIRLGAFDLSGTISGSNGSTASVPNVYASIDHPFHITRASTLLDNLRSGELTRWISHHQGGYPVEFYPLGGAWLDVLVWAISLGTLSVAAAHKLALISIFLLPGLAFSLLARRDRLPAATASLAFVLHIGVSGEWWSGGYTELISWGLSTNVAAATAMIFTLHFTNVFVADTAPPALVIAVGTAAFAIYANPRSVIALAVIGLAVWLANLRRNRRAGGPSLVRVALIGALTSLIAAPELFSLIRFNDLYFFLRYETYETVGEFARSSAQAVSTPVIYLAALGLGLSVVRRAQGSSLRAVGFALALYVGVTLLLTSSDTLSGLVDQLETPRMMPFQRFLMIYLAAAGIAAVIRGLAIRVRRPALTPVLMALLVVLVAIGINGSLIGRGEAERGLYPVTSSVSPALVDLFEAVNVADALAAEDTALFVVGSALSWHAQLWAPLETNRPLFYDNWLWYWHTHHAGPYDYRQGHSYLQPTDALYPGYYARHGIGAVIITGISQSAIMTSSSGLQPARVGEGVYDVYLVSQPTKIVTFPGTSAASITLSNGLIEAEGNSAGGTLVVRHNWHPRWSARVNGRPVRVERREDGYMNIPVPAGEVTLELIYAVDAFDWSARVLALIGVVSTISLGVPLPRRLRGGKPLVPIASNEVTRPKVRWARR